MVKKRIEEIEAVKRTYRDLFFRGLTAVLPTILTFYIVIVCWQALDQNIAAPINRGITGFLKDTSLGNWVATLVFDIPPGRDVHDAIGTAIDQSYPSWVGLVAAVVLVLVVGALITSFLGRKIWEVVETRLVRLPVVRTIYPYAKQLTDFFFSQDEKEARKFSAVCAVEFPNKGIWSVGFVTGGPVRGLNEAAGTDVVTVFIPFAPTPFTGFVVCVPERAIVPLPVSVDEALRYYISCGVIVPGYPAAAPPPGAAGPPGRPSGRAPAAKPEASGVGPQG